MTGKKDERVCASKQPNTTSSLCEVIMTQWPSFMMIASVPSQQPFPRHRHNLPSKPSSSSPLIQRFPSPTHQPHSFLFPSFLFSFIFVIPSFFFLVLRPSDRVRTPELRLKSNSRPSGCLSTRRSISSLSFSSSSSAWVHHASKKSIKRAREGKKTRGKRTMRLKSLAEMAARRATLQWS